MSNEHGWRPQLSKWASLLLIATSYVAAVVGAVVVVELYLSFIPVVAFISTFALWRVFAIDMLATIFVFLVAYLCNNVSVYDPYWHVIPLLANLYFLTLVPVIGMKQIVASLLMWAWGLRLTYNWARAFDGLQHEDYRYTDQREATGKLFWLVALLGDMVFPTLLVFLGIAAHHHAIVDPTPTWTFLDTLGAVLCALGIVLQGVADNHLAVFRRRKAAGEIPRGALLREGVWGQARHPNYQGEILFWFGVGLLSESHFWGAAIALAIYLLFVGVSVQLKDNRGWLRVTRGGNVKEYEEYLATPTFLLHFPPDMLWFTRRRRPSWVVVD